MPFLVLQKVDSDDFSVKFNLGEHIIGRGSKLLCTSKSVSRNHGLLKVTNNGMFLQSIHNNPCFYKQCSATNISLLLHGNTIQINNEDKIALSVDHGWFRVQIENSENSTNTENSHEANTLENNQDLNSNVAIKREIEKDNEVESKKFKLNEPTNEEQEILNADNVIKTEPPDEHSNATCSNANNGMSMKIKKEPFQIENSENSTNTENPRETNTSDNNKDLNSNVAVKREIEKDNEVESKKLKLNEPTNEEQEILNADNVIKTEPPDEHSNATCSNGMSVKIKKEPLEDNNIDIKSEPIDTKDNIEDIKKEMETENEDKDCEKDLKKDSPSTSGTNTIWRDRCWYGRSCYRKNPVHYAEFRHPGDADYDSDPNDPRPNCSYGVDCYRKNQLHRRRLRHSGQEKLGRKPLNLRNLLDENSEDIITDSDYESENI